MSCRPGGRSAQNNLIANGSFNAARWSGLPAHWHPVRDDASSVLRWHRSATGGEVSIENSRRSSSYWLQTVYLRPGWYHLTGEIRVENVSPKGSAKILLEGVDGSSAGTASVSGSTSWQPVGLYLEEAHWGDTVAVGCYLCADTGRAWFRRIRLEPVAGPPNSGDPVVRRVEPAHGIESEADGRKASTAFGVISLLLLSALIGWSIYDLWGQEIRRPRPELLLALATATAILLLELLVAGAFDGYFSDAQSRFARASIAASSPLADIYDHSYPNAYPPGSIYPLWVSGILAHRLEPRVSGVLVLMKAPTLLCSFILAIVLFMWVSEWMNARQAFAAMLLFALNPALIYDSVIWGQSEVQYTLPMILSFVLIMRKKIALGWALAALAVLVKPQAAPLIPVLAIYTLCEAKASQWVAALGAIAAVVVVTVLPFQVGHSVDWMMHVYRDLAGRYPLASAGAFNLYALLGGWQADDSAGFGVLSYFTVGVVLLLALYCLVAWMIWRDRQFKRMLLAAFMALFGAFLLATRMHERYEYAALVFLVPLALETPLFTLVFALLSADYLANLVYVMLASDCLLAGKGWIVVCGALVNLAIFVAVVAYAIRSIGSSPDQHKRRTEMSAAS